MSRIISISAKQNLIVIMTSLLITSLIAILVIFLASRNTSVEESQPVASVETTAECEEWKPVYTAVHNMIFELRLEHPDIVMAQAIEESGHFRSTLFKDGNNCFGMKVPYSRPTTAIGTFKGHARYGSIRDCILDYAIWQSSYAKGLSREEYFIFLDNTYAIKGGYSERLRKIIIDNSL